MGWYVVYSVIMQSWVVGGYFRVQIMRICLSKLCLKNWCGWDVFWGPWCSVCVRESVSKPAILTQASQARLGEIGRDAYPLSTRGHRSGGGFWSLGEGSSRLGEWDSPKWEIVCNYVFWLNNSCRRGWLLFWVGVRLAQAIPSRLFLWDSSPRRGIFLLGEREYVGCSGAGGLHRLGA